MKAQGDLTTVREMASSGARELWDAQHVRDLESGNTSLQAEVRDLQAQLRRLRQLNSAAGQTANQSQNQIVALQEKIARGIRANRGRDWDEEVAENEAVSYAYHACRR